MKVVCSTIAQDLEDINAKVKSSSLALRKERVRMMKVKRILTRNLTNSFLKLKAKELSEEDTDFMLSDIDTDINIQVNVKDLARTEGIVRSKLN